MAQSDTSSARPSGTALAVLPGVRGPRPSFARLSTAADFLSQLLAERQHLPAQRARRRAPLGVVLEAYSEGRERGIPRLPAGSYRSRVV